MLRAERAYSVDSCTIYLVQTRDLPHSKNRPRRSYRDDWRVRRPRVLALLEACQQAADSPSILQRTQDAWLRETVRSAYRNCLFYRENYPREQVEQFQGTTDLSQLPRLSRTQLQQNLDGIAATGLRDFSDCTSYSSSGSTGEPVSVLRSRDAMLLDSALLRLILRRYGIDHVFRPSRPSLFFLLQNTWSLEERMPMLNMGRYYRFPIDAPTWDSPEHLLRFLARHPGVPLSSNPQSLTQLLDLCRAEDPTSKYKIRPSIVMSGGAELSSQMSESFRSLFKAPIVNLYASIEMGLVGIQCPTTSAFHVESTTIAECLDSEGAPVPTGEMGEIVLTNLTNPKFPMLRYNVGDFGTVEHGQCSCGSFLPRITSLMGRTNTLFVTGRGEKVVPATLNRELRKLPLFQYQLEQQSVEQFVMRYRPSEACDNNVIKVAVEQALKKRFGKVHVDCQASSSLGSDGKKVQAFIANLRYPE